MPRLSNAQLRMGGMSWCVEFETAQRSETEVTFYVVTGTVESSLDRNTIRGRSTLAEGSLY